MGQECFVLTVFVISNHSFLMRTFWSLVFCFGLCLPLRSETGMEERSFVVPATLLDLNEGQSVDAKLESVGISFPEGASAIYRFEKSTLIV